jgi:hypothetical protein
MDGALIGTREWCRICKAWRIVVDDHEEAYLSGATYSYNTTEHTVRVLDLGCDHSQEYEVGSKTYRDAGA